MRKTVLITGSARGIGRAVALRFAQEGFKLVVNGRTETEQLRTLRDEIFDIGADCMVCVCDVSDPNAVRRMVEQAEDRFGGIDILVNNAGISHTGLLSDMSDDEWNRIISVNLSSVFYCCRGVIPGMVKRKEGVIINVSSIWGNIGASCEVAYSAAKGGVNSFTKALAKELAPCRIAVNAVACGMIDTDMNRCYSAEELAAIQESIPAGRMGTPMETAELIYSIANITNYLTGQIITMDGGWF